MFSDTPKVSLVGFDVPGTQAWVKNEKKTVLGVLSTEPSEAWIAVFQIQVALRGKDVSESTATIQKDQLIFTASRRNVSRLCMQFREIVASTEVKMMELRLAGPA